MCMHWVLASWAGHRQSMHDLSTSSLPSPAHMHAIAGPRALEPFFGTWYFNPTKKAEGLYVMLGPVARVLLPHIPTASH